MNNRRTKVLYSLPILAVAFLLAASPITLLASSHKAPSGTIELIQWKVGFIIGGGGGSGKLNFKGESHKLGIKGLRVGAVIGVARADIKGEVFNLTNVKDIEGNYQAFEASGAFAGGPAKVWKLKNDKGVVLQLQGAQAGLELALDYGGMWLKLK